MPEDVWLILDDANKGNCQRQSKLCEEIQEKDWDIGQALQTRAAVMAATEWNIIPARGDSSAEAKSIAADVKEDLKSIRGDYFQREMDFDGLINSFSRAYLPGFAVSEIVWQADGTIEGFRQWPSHYFTYRNSITPRLLGIGDYIGKPLPPDKFCVHEFLPRGNDPTRGGLIRPLAWLFAFKSLTFKDLIRYVEKFGMPFILAKMNAADDKAFQEEAAKLMSVIENFGSDGGGLFSQAIDLEFKDGATNAGEVYYSFVDLCERAIQKIILGQTSSSDSRNSNRSTAEVHDLVRHDLSAYDAGLIKRTIDQQILPPLVRYKYGVDAPIPEIEFDVTSYEQTLMLMQIVKTANEAGYKLKDIEELSRLSGLDFEEKETPEPLQMPGAEEDDPEEPVIDDEPSEEDPVSDE